MPPGSELTGFGELQFLSLGFLEAVKVAVKIRSNHLARMKDKLAVPLLDQFQPL